MEEGKLLLKVVSPTGCVHLVSRAYGNKYRTECNHTDYYQRWGEGYYHKWELTEKPVTCKRCLMTLEPVETPKPETKLKTIVISGSFEEKNRSKVIMSELKKDGCTVDDIISITLKQGEPKLDYQSEPHQTYIVWYKKGVK